MKIVWSDQSAEEIKHKSTLSELLKMFTYLMVCGRMKKCTLSINHNPKVAILPNSQCVFQLQSVCWEVCLLVIIDIPFMYQTSYQYQLYYISPFTFVWLESSGSDVQQLTTCCHSVHFRAWFKTLPELQHHVIHLHHDDHDEGEGQHTSPLPCVLT